MTDSVWVVQPEDWNLCMTTRSLCENCCWKRRCAESQGVDQKQRCIKWWVWGAEEALWSPWHWCWYLHLRILLLQETFRVCVPGWTAANCTLPVRGLWPVVPVLPSSALCFPPALLLITQWVAKSMWLLVLGHCCCTQLLMNLLCC